MQLNITIFLKYDTFQRNNIFFLLYQGLQLFFFSENVNQLLFFADIKYYYYWKVMWMFSYFCMAELSEHIKVDLGIKNKLSNLRDD